ncbi:indolethylamine N-methyltransferase [Ixodes scapularis]|uniref:indolethylamine N-methyltransferase n=1 Tax=Ixodes scapularis TaxID=6945 RepID=UPI001A9FD45E|nr:indolethylamine N-methyltransferase [Ixodes scapularis]
MQYEDLQEKYRSQFVPEAYRDTLETIHSLLSFYQKELHFIFTSPTFYGRKLLEVGCGPSARNVLPATKKIDDVVLGDLVPQNRLAVEKWIQKAPDAIDWSFHSELLATLEGYIDAKSGAREIEERTRRAIRKVVFCNVLDPQVLPEEHKEPFDVVLTCLCLESACLDEGTYKKAVQNLANLVTSGGYLIVCGICGSDDYVVKGVTFPVLAASVDLAKKAITRCEFEIERCTSMEQDALQAKDRYCWQQGFVILARKL